MIERRRATFVIRVQSGKPERFNVSRLEQDGTLFGTRFEEVRSRGAAEDRAEHPADASGSIWLEFPGESFSQIGRRHGKP
jgi:hypothetical protein